MNHTNFASIDVIEHSDKDAVVNIAAGNIEGAYSLCEQWMKANGFFLNTMDCTELQHEDVKDDNYPEYAKLFQFTIMPSVVSEQPKVIRFEQVPTVS